MYIRKLKIINNDYLFNILASEPMGSFFMPKILVNLFFCVTRMTDEDGKIESGRNVGNIIKT